MAVTAALPASRKVSSIAFLERASYGTRGAGASPDEALRMGHNYVGTEHILLALLELEDGTGPLASLGLSKDAAEASILEALAKI